MKKQLLMKTFLVAVSMLVGTSAWAETVNVNSTESAYVLKSSTINYDGTSNALVAYYTQYRNWGNYDGTANFRNNDAKLVLYKFSLSDFKNASGNLTSVTFTFHTTSTESCYDIFAVGYNETWSASTVTGANMTNNAGTITGVVSATGSFQPLGEGYAALSNNSQAKDISVDATTYVLSAINANLDYVSFAVGINLQRNLPLNSTAKLSGEFTTAAATTYTIKFQNEGGTDLKESVINNTFVGETYTASAAEMATFYSQDNNTKYVYKSGNESKVATSTAGNNVITLVFDEYAKIAYTVTAKNGEETLGVLASGDAYTDGSTSVYWNKFKKFSDQWYVTTANYGKSITKAGNTDVAYTVSDISYFYEFETLTRNGGSAVVNETGSSYSNNISARIANSSGSYATLYTPAIAAGVYDLAMPYYNGNGVTENDVIYVYVTNDISSLGDPVHTFQIENTSGATFSTTITIPDGYFVAFQGAHYYSTNSKARIDYLTLTPTVVSATIPTSGYGTIASAYALDCANLPGGLKAYKVTGLTAETVTLEEVTEAVAANTGLILKGTASTAYDIPVAASGTDISATNKLKAAVTATNIAANAAYILQNGEFHLVTAASTIPAGKAYLLASSPDPARSLNFTFDATAIKAVEGEIQNGEFYNVAGQRVAQPTKGLYIVNGKKVVVK